MGEGGSRPANLHNPFSLWGRLDQFQNWVPDRSSPVKVRSAEEVLHGDDLAPVGSVVVPNSTSADSVASAGGKPVGSADAKKYFASKPGIFNWLWLKNGICQKKAPWELEPKTKTCVALAVEF